MIGAPLALLGLLAVAVPIIIHLLGRHQSRVERFPTLRFIGTSRLNPTKRRRISDLPLLLLRMAIVALAALALSQPFFGGGSETSSAVSRVLIVDTSASASRGATDTIQADVRVETAEPGRAVDGAVAWLATRAGARELAIVSDFQRASIDTADLAAIPSDIGLAVYPTPSTTPGVDSARNDGERARDDISTFAGPADIAADDAWRAIGRARPTNSTGRIAIIYRGFPGAADLIARSTYVDSLWMARIVARLQADETLKQASGQWRPTGERLALDTIRNTVYAGRNGSRLLIFLRDDPGGLVSAALNDALVRSTREVPASESDSAFMNADELARWRRAATPMATASLTGSHGRWLWMLCLVLLGLEQWLRRRTPRAA